MTIVGSCRSARSLLTGSFFKAMLLQTPSSIPSIVHFPPFYPSLTFDLASPFFTLFVAEMMGGPGG